MIFCSGFVKGDIRAMINNYLYEPALPGCTIGYRWRGPAKKQPASSTIVLMCCPKQSLFQNTTRNIYPCLPCGLFIFLTILWEIFRPSGSSSFGNAIFIINKCAIYDFISSKCEELFSYLHSSTGCNRSWALYSPAAAGQSPNIPKCLIWNLTFFLYMALNHSQLDYRG